MEISTVITIIGFIVTIAVYVAMIARWSGKTSTQIDGLKEDITRLEKKQDKHNCLVERMVEVEQRSKSNTHRLNEIDSEHGAWVDKK